MSKTVMPQKYRPEMDFPQAAMSQDFRVLVGPTIKALVREQRALGSTRRSLLDGIASRKATPFAARAIRERLDVLENSVSLVLPSGAIRALQMELSAVGDSSDEGSQVTRVVESVWAAFETEETRDLRVQLWKLDARDAATGR